MWSDESIKNCVMERQNTNLNCWTLWIFCRFVRSLGLMSQIVPERPNFLFLWQELLRSKGEKPLKTPQLVYYIPDYTSESDPRSRKVTKQLQIKLRKNSDAPTGFKPMTSLIPVRCFTTWAMNPRQKQVKCEFNLYPLYEENADMICRW